MINEVIIVGVFKGEEGFIEIKGKKYLKIIVEVEKAFMNSDGQFERDKIECLLWKGEADRLLDLKSNINWLSIKGRLEFLVNRMYVMAEKVKFLDAFISNS